MGSIRARGARARAGRGAQGRRAVVAVATMLTLFGPLVFAARAEPHRVEVVGTYPIRESMRGKVNPRDEAIQKALWEGVSRVALELIGEEQDPGDSEELDAAGTGSEQKEVGEPDATARFRKVFGREILPYTRSFRIVEDRGERPVLFADEPGVRSEYLVVVEVIVDVDRVSAELARAGLIPGDHGAVASQTVTVELIGIERYAGLRRVLDALRSALAVTRVETLEFSPLRQLLRVEVPYGPDELAAKLGRLESAELVLEPVEIDREGRRIRVLARWFPPGSVEEPTDPVRSGSAAPASVPH